MECVQLTEGKKSNMQHRDKYKRAPEKINKAPENWGS